LTSVLVIWTTTNLKGTRLKPNLKGTKLKQNLGLMWRVLLWHCHNKAIVYFNSFIMTKNNPIAGESKFINCSRSLIKLLLVSLDDIRYPVKDLWYTWSKDFCHSYIIYNYHPCWSVTRRFVSQRKVGSSEGLPEGFRTFRGETDKPSGHTPTRVIIGILYPTRVIIVYDIRVTKIFGSSIPKVLNRISNIV
jgi:hypothetical protein